ncbi:AraC family transcriptional regulator [Dactylosporangium matsuzakiense]|uniref:AraC family transcriptional regulator n=1 Tax=Dactylosporangium matsuzakiense TaxID=53360 RepID=A0A9W6KEV5_9ACTN|nr:AraC family transcriptional regulator [Dactylosporangium matsuzakiense]UWZ44085.1 AraC family transcriptional regulator [Dactylosporangium matsuzakiense]GLL00782.1 AraC family transcriptional regulator [Dactylosporangium matsuzakiense]
MDVLSDVLVAMRTGRPTAARSSSRAPWGVRFHRGKAAGCHVVLAGGCWLVSGTGEPLPLGVGDVLFTPHGDGYALVDQLGSPIVDFEPRPGDATPLDEMHIEGAGAVTELLCAYYMFDPARPHPLLADLPAIIHVPARVGQHPSLRSAVEMLGSELLSPRPGTEAVLPSLIDMLLLYVLRAWLAERPDSAAGWATALRDPAITTALRRIHRHPEKPWTVEDLAAVAGLSRAAFAKRFATIIGQPPLAYLTWWRMTTAARLLRESGAPLRTVATRCGYGSEYAFGKAFKRAYDVAPGQYRAQHPT